MNFETLNKQRKLVLIAAACGIICMFLTWVTDIYGINHNGMKDWGVVVFLCLLLSAALAWFGEQSKPIKRLNWIIVIIAGAIATLIMLIGFFNATSYLSALKFGFYGAFSASIGVLVFAYNNRAGDDSLANGFDTLKEAIGSKASATPGSKP